MSASTLGAHGLASAAPVRALVPTLAVAEGRRLLLHPLTLLGFGLWVVAAGQMLLSAQIDPVPAFESVSIAMSFIPGVPMIVAAHMVTTRDRRAGALDLLGSTPGRAEERVRALCLAACAPALLALLLNAGLLGLLVRLGSFVEAPSLWQVAQGPATVLGAGLLGIMVGTWAPALVSPVLATVAMVGLHLAVAEHERIGLLAPALSWVDWGTYDGSVWVGELPGSQAEHVRHMAGLGTMAAAAAVLRVTERRRPVVVLSLLSLAVTVTAGVLQLP